MDHAYNRYVNLKPGYFHDRKHQVSMFNRKFFCAEAKLTLVELGRTHQYQEENFDACMRRFHERALDCYTPVAEDVQLTSVHTV